MNVSETPLVSVNGLALIRIRNPYVAAAYGFLASRAVNPPEAVLKAAARTLWLKKFGPPGVAFLADSAVERVELELPWLLMTAWRADLDGVVTSREGAKSVVEHRMYMRNPMARISVAVPRPQRTVEVFATRHDGGIAGEALRWLGLAYGRVVLGEYGRELYVIDIDPVPPVGSPQEAEALLDAI